MTGEAKTHYEVIVVGAGVAGIYQIKRLADLGIDATVLEAAPDLGGTWYWNRYPGCRFDSESYTYGFSFSRELLDEWHWKERFSGQPENLRYLNYVADKFDLRKHMQFNCKVETMQFDETRDLWQLRIGDGRELTSRFVVLAIGLLSAPTMPRVLGIDDFKGRSFHTYHWPHEPVDLAGKKVAVIGTGATGIQLIGEIADKVGELTVFQRRPNWSAPLNNSAISDQEMADIRARYDEIFAACALTPGSFVHGPDKRGFYEVSREERLNLWDKLYDEPGFGIWLANFREIFMDEAANAELSEYIAGRIRQRVNDPDVAEKLIPRDHGFGVQRLPLETRYFEAYNRDNVQLVDLSETPLVRVTEKGLRSTARDYDFDIIVYATGFDAITGAYDLIDIRGIGGERLADKWKHAPSTFLGMLVHGFPNLLMPTGPQSASASTNFPRGIENGVNWCTNLLQYMWDRGLTRADATLEAQQRWTAHVVKMYEIMLMRKAKSWFTGYNSNVAGHEEGTVRYFVYNGGTPKFLGIINGVAAEGYREIAFGAGARGGAQATVGATAS
ncbi:flavin-containing monooxygenase [Bradyrhizobium elkanii]|uniref:flavin-containing monooxygenase n=1 Tax=Bradyrhizobium elkanii TaxID=29448 RepID=UPI00209C79F9|nr:NAD(P)/FAD-dependent oxidoreductase [Bradyrhizobium elkanii]MCP1967761.1 cation diffusion facilitator CzcD-associated flavoprotein CzcO [Bradyrhizobium elkanii]MCS3524056.1 cation diffusion facilitator CzcD-associated flavoprotein CzcO [Bradyrhizobium elkanii]MCS4071712.1 cation diffusion facilitator CzcD-associated flavoprotein CzcO [Bradyrhizobium elkanii]MCS4078344.1 cation diffusion facilitator CzcD-associated flavoprotein CzcO [Bradyrhizobium elkanii]MCS4110737.1 cation diffusion facil